MTPAAAIPLFFVSIGVMLAAASTFARRLDFIGLRLGLPEALLGLLTALAADAPAKENPPADDHHPDRPA